MKFSRPPGRSATGNSNWFHVEQQLLASCKGILPSLGAAGGTVLVPVHATSDRLDSLIEEASAATGLAITATAIEAPTPDLPRASKQAHSLLDLVVRKRQAPGLHRLDALVIEHQLLLPGPARRGLASLLDPLFAHPDLIETLRVYCACDFNKKRTARKLRIHPNTLHYRLRRVAGLTTADPRSHLGAQNLRAALLAHDAEPKGNDDRPTTDSCRSRGA